MSKEEVKVQEEKVSKIIDKDKKLKDEAVASLPKRPVRRSDVVAAGPYAIDKKLYDGEGYVFRWCHLEQPNKMDKFLVNLGYDFVRDPITNEPVFKTVKVGSEIRKSFLIKTPEDLYRQGVREKEERQKSDLGRLESPDENQGQFIIESNIRQRD